MEPIAFESDGQRIYAEHHAPEHRSRAGVVLLHGFNSCVSEFGRAGAHLAEHGLHALAFDQRGFGASGGERGRLGLDGVLRDTLAAADWLETHAGVDRMGLLGHSLGGAYALGVLSQSDRFRAGAVAHPLERLFDEIGAVERFVYHVAGRRGRRRMAAGLHAGWLPRPVPYRDLFVSEEARRQAEAEPFLQTRVHVGNYDFARTMSASAWARAVEVPVLAVLSDTDRMVDPANSHRVVDAIAGPVEVYRHHGGHSCFRDLDGERVTDAAARWFLRHLGEDP